MPRYWVRRIVSRFTLQFSPRQVQDSALRKESYRTGDVDECEVVVGLDFGTSATKVVVRTPDLPGERAVPVDFDDLGERQEYVPDTVAALG